MIEFVKENGLFAVRKGNQAWKLMEKRHVLPNRSWQSMKNRCIKHLFPKMSADEFQESKRDLTVGLLQKNSYLLEEDNRIVRYIADKDYYDDVRKRWVWREMVSLEILPGRTADSLRERFRRVIAPKIKTACYDLTVEELNRFLS